MNISLVKSNKGKDKLIVDGYVYHLDKRGESFNWSCAERKSYLCKGRVVTYLLDGNQVIKKGPTLHSHDPKAFEKTVSEVNSKLKDNAQTVGVKPSQIIRQSVVECEPNSRVYLPSAHAQKQKISRARSDSLKEPTTLLEIVIPDNLKYIEGELFVLSEKEFHNDKIILLGTISSLKLLAEAKCWLMDGTFEVVPSIMRQLFSIHGLIGNEIVPLIFCIMSSKSKEAYTEMFYELCRVACEFNISLNPLRFVSDFEKASVAAAKVFFPTAIFKGCLFHFGQIIWRRVQSEGRATKYGSNEDFSLQIRMLKSLAFVPPQDVVKYYAQLKPLFDADAKKIGSWFETNYLTGDLAKKRNKSSKPAAPMYSPDFWSVIDTQTENFPRTQNSVEAWHRRLKVVIGKPHIGVYLMISELSKELIIAKTRIEKMKAGIIIPKKRKLEEKNKKIANVMKERINVDPISYLKNIAHNISLE